jgi:hypothetical protein
MPPRQAISGPAYPGMTRQELPVPRRNIFRNHEPINCGDFDAGRVPRWRLYCSRDQAAVITLNNARQNIMLSRVGWLHANGLSAEITHRQQDAAIALKYISRQVIIGLRFALSGTNIASTKPGLALTFRSVADETHRVWSDP